MLTPNEYIKKLETVTGFARPYKHFHILEMIDQIIECEGGVAEIGVYFGQFLLTMNYFTDYPSFGFDIFDDKRMWSSDKNELVLPNEAEDLNFNFAQVQKTLYEFDAHNVTLHKLDSISQRHEIRRILEGQKIKYFHVDGGHSRRHLLNDLYIAQDVIEPAGMVIVDDYNIRWSEVVQGVHDYMDAGTPLVPVVYDRDKLYMVNCTYHDFYYKKFKNIFTSENRQYAEWNIKNTPVLSFLDIPWYKYRT